MTEQEIKEWLGLGDVPRRLRHDIVAAMADVPVPPPGPTNQHVPAMGAFLRAVGGRPGAVNLWEPLHPPVRIRFVTWDEATDGVAIYQDGELVWQEDTFASFAQYLRAQGTPLGVPVILEVGEEG